MAAKLRVLMLHGWTQNAEAFTVKTYAFARKLTKVADLTFAEAPGLVDPMLAPGKDNPRCWWAYKHRELRDSADPTRFFTHFVHESWHISRAYLARLWREKGPFDVVVGFSQGAVVLHQLLLELEAATRLAVPAASVFTTDGTFEIKTGFAAVEAAGDAASTAAAAAASGPAPVEDYQPFLDHPPRCAVFSCGFPTVPTDLLAALEALASVGGAAAATAAAGADASAAAAAAPSAPSTAPACTCEQASRFIPPLMVPAAPAGAAASSGATAADPPDTPVPASSSADATAATAAAADAPAGGATAGSGAAPAAAQMVLSPEAIPRAMAAVAAAAAAAPSTPAAPGHACYRSYPCGRLPVLAIPTLHAIAINDNVVPPSLQYELAAGCAAPVYVFTDKGHSMPQRAGDVDAIAAFMMQHCRPEAAAAAAADGGKGKKAGGKAKAAKAPAGAAATTPATS